MDIDRRLIGILNGERLRNNPRRKHLERDAELAFREYLRVMEARARLDSEFSALGGDNLAIWRAISQVQQFDILVNGVDRKIDALQRLTQRRADQSAAERTRCISTWLGLLAALTIVTATIAGVAYFVGSAPSGKGTSGSVSQLS